MNTTETQVQAVASDEDVVQAAREAMAAPYDGSMASEMAAHIRAGRLDHSSPYGVKYAILGARAAAAVLRARPAAPAEPVGGLLYRPHKHDDWGFIRTVDGELFAAVRRPLDEEEANEHRRNGTDPFEPLARALMNALGADQTPEYERCPSCGGSGQQWTGEDVKPCYECKGDTVVPVEPTPGGAPDDLVAYDAGLLNDFGGGDVGWWQDYIRAELERADEFYRQQYRALRDRLHALEVAHAQLQTSLDTQATTIEGLRGENERLTERNLELNILADAWMQRHDRIAAGKDGGPYPSPVDVPESIARATAAEAKLAGVEKQKRAALIDLLDAATKFAISVREHSGLAYPWPALDIAADKALAALKATPASTPAAPEMGSGS